MATPHPRQCRNGLLVAGPDDSGAAEHDQGQHRARDSSNSSSHTEGKGNTMLIHWKTVLAGVLCAAGCSQLATLGLAQVAPPAILRIEYENGVRYVYDTVDIPAFATVPTPVSQGVPTFATMVLVADVVTVNGKPAKGIFLTRQTVANLTTNPSAGQAIADAVRTNVVERIVEIQKPDGTPIGSIMALGFNGGEVPPGAPAGAMVGSFAITGGTGAFLGVRGQAADGGVIIANRNGSVKEDPAKRRVNGGGKASAVVQLIPMTRPEIINTPSGPAVTHLDSTLVTAANPATAGETLILYATGLGPTRPGVDPGKPFTTSPQQIVNSPVEVAANGALADVLYAGGFPGSVDGYHVSFRLPAGTAPGQVSLQLTVAFIPGPEVKIPVK